MRPPPGAPADWQPGAMLRMTFSEHCAGAAAWFAARR